MTCMKFHPVATVSKWLSSPKHNATGRFRVLIVGRAGCGKTTILTRFCGANIADSPGEHRGLHRIDHELVSDKNPSFVAHDSRGAEAGSDEEYTTFMNFIHERGNMEATQRIHAIWYCIQANERPIQASERQFFSTDHGKVPVIVIVTKYDTLIESCLQDIENDRKSFDDVSDPDQSLKDEEAWARTQAHKIFQAHCREPLMRMKYPPNAIVRLEHAEDSAVSSKELLRDLTQATMRCIKDSDTDILMVFARARGSDEADPSFFALLSYHLYQRPKLRSVGTIGSISSGIGPNTRSPINDPTTYMTFWAPENYEIVISDAMAKHVDHRPNEVYRHLPTQHLRGLAVRIQALCDIWIVLQILGHKRDRLSHDEIERCIKAYGNSISARDLQQAIVASCRPDEWVKWRSFWQIYSAMEGVARQARDKFLMEWRV